MKTPLIFECVGAPGVLQSLAMAAPARTRIVVAGVCMETDATEPLAMIVKEIEPASCWATPRGIRRVVEELHERPAYAGAITGVVA